MRRTAPASSEPRARPWAALLLIVGCATPPSPESPAPADVPGPEEVLLTSAEAWNRGDLEGFLAPYLDSPELTFVGGTGVLEGLAELRERYRAGFFREGPPSDRLTFHVLQTRGLGDGHALMIGRYVLTADDGGESSGIFTLVWTLTREGWRILHDHTSESPPG